MYPLFPNGTCRFLVFDFDNHEPEAESADYANTDDSWMEEVQALRDAGFHIELAEETCEHYAIVDGEIVWYGSMNLLSKEDMEDNIMRVVSRDIAAELLEMTFGR